MEPLQRSSALLVLLVFIQTIGPVTGNSIGTDEPTAPITAEEWLVVVYMAGDNDLGQDDPDWGNALIMDLEEMEESMPDDGLRVLALADLYGDSNTHLYDIVNDPREGIQSPKIDLDQVNPSWGDELDTGNWRTVRDLLVFAMENTTAERSMFVLWDHGSGWYRSMAPSRKFSTRGFSMDWTSGSRMYLDDLRNAFTEAEDQLSGLEMDVFGMDTCSMGMMEVFYQFAPWFDLAIGSEDEQPWYGYNYTFISGLGGSDPLTPAEVCEEIVDLFSMEYIDPVHDYATIVVVDLDALSGNLTMRWNELSRLLIERMYHLEAQRPHLFRAARYSAESVGFENVDIGDFLKELVVRDLNQNITEAAVSAWKEYNVTVLSEWRNPTGRNPDATGVKVYLPPNGSYSSQYSGSSGFLNFTADTLWDEMIREFHEPVERVYMKMETLSLDPDGLEDDLKVTVTDPRAPGRPPIDGATIYLDRINSGSTNESGELVLKDLLSGTYMVEAYNGTHVAIGEIKVMNRPPVARTDPESVLVNETISFIVDASDSEDPDGDRITFMWDLDPSDGPDDVDSTSSFVQLSYDEATETSIRLTVSDGELTDQVDIPVTVENIPPTAVISGPGQVYEDEAFNVSGEFSYDTAPDRENLSYRFSLDNDTIRDWGPEPNIGLNLSMAGKYLIVLEVKDPDGDVGRDQLELTVLNTGPTAVITGPSRALEDEPLVFFASSSSDTGSDLPGLIFSWFVSGPENITQEGPYLNISFGISGMYNVTLNVEDDDGSTDMTWSSLEVSNPPPTAVISCPEEVIEDEMFILDGSESSDNPSDLNSLRYGWDLDGDGISDLHGISVSASFYEAGERSIGLMVSDDDGEVSWSNATLVVKNLPPEPVINGTYSGREDQTLFFRADPGADTPSDDANLTFSWALDGEQMVMDGRSVEVVLTSEGQHRISVTAADDQNETGSNVLFFNITNPPPLIILQGVPKSIKEGDSFTVDASGTTDTDSDMGLLRFDWYLDGDKLDEAGDRVTIKAKGVGSHTLRLVVTDDEGASSAEEFEFEVEKAPFMERLLANLISGFGLALLLVLLLLFMGAVYQVRDRMGKLKHPDREASPLKQDLGYHDLVDDDEDEDEKAPVSPSGEEREVNPDEIEQKLIEEEYGPNETTEQDEKELFDGEDEMYDDESLSILGKAERPGHVPPPPGFQEPPDVDPPSPPDRPGELELPEPPEIEDIDMERDPL